MPIGAALIGGGAGIWGASQAGKYSSSANTQNQKMLSPYTSGGANAMLELSDPSKYFQSSPGFQFALQQGKNSVNTNAATNGLLRSGGAVKSLQANATGLADTDFNNWWSQQQGLATTGLNATNSGLQSNEWNANNQGNMALTAGNVIGQTAGSLSAGTSANLGNLMSQYMGGGGSSYGGG